MKNDVERIVLSEKKIKTKVKKLGKQLVKDYTDKNPIFICILNGAAIFFADLIRAMDIPLEIDFMKVASYGDSAETSGVVKIEKDIGADIRGRHVVLVEDIVDTGLTIEYLKKYLQNHKPASVVACSLLNKPNARKTEVKVEYIGFNIENDFVVGYGLDFAQKYRNLCFVGALKKEIYQKK